MKNAIFRRDFTILSMAMLLAATFAGSRGVTRVEESESVFMGKAE